MIQNNKIVLALASTFLLTACGGDSGGGSDFSLPMPPAGFGANNDISLVSYNTSVSEPTFSQQTCSSNTDNLARRQQLRFYDGNKVSLAIRAYQSRNCAQPIELAEYEGQFEIKGTQVLNNGNSVVQVEMIFTQAWSTPLSQSLVDARNGSDTGGGICDRKDWAIGQRVNVSNYEQCFPLFPESERQQFRLVRKETLQSTLQPALFLDDPDRKEAGATYANELDTTPFLQGEL
ncbi:hypothetical protein [Bacterioplanoides sp. SCSIO 12839]|uniref:hypothetical protein n=1 Tax=Bacterioplanoides sp. SCSIO 12839 TaxID=2829569 RepID=UPI002101F8D1|nr:hypothetical protein [Bacterioplanoides sp. SCSIO 12839]UTW48240.1 hypothetical protein KFF03_17080 [Bacterioplanoides sp. SCSIO 12839]